MRPSVLSVAVFTLRTLAVAWVLVGAPMEAFAQIPITVAWDANADGLTTGYLVTIGTTPGAPQATVDAGLATSTVLPLAPGAVYHVAVQAYDIQRNAGPATPEILVDLANAPAAPRHLTASVSGTTATLTWQPPSGGGIPLRYLLSVGTAPGGSNVLMEASLGNALAVSGPVPPGTYYARIQAGNMVGVGPVSPDVEFQVGTRPQAPSALVATRAGDLAVFSWSPPAGTPPATYRLEAGTGPGLTDVATVLVGAATSFSAPAPAGQYFVRVRALDSAGLTSPPSNEVILPALSAPTAPRSLVSNVSGGVVTLTWSASASGSPTSYVVEAGSASGLANLATVNVGNVTSFSAAAPPGVYHVRVRALNAAGVSPASNETIVQR